MAGPGQNIHLATFPMVDAKTISVIYTNHRGITTTRRIRPLNVYWGKNQWHLEPQWMTDAYDEERGAIRSFTLKDMKPV